MSKEMKEAIKILIFKARNAAKSEDALRFSQAACNVAHAMETLQSIELE